MRGRDRRIRFAAPWWCAIAVTVATVARGADDGGSAQVLWARSQQDWLPRLGTALETMPGTGSVSWAAPASGLSGRLTVFPADAANCRRFRVEVSGAEAVLDGQGVRCRGEGGVWLATAEPDRVVPRPNASDPAVAALQRDLGRLRYYDGPVDGTRSAALDAGARAFAADEELPPDTALPALRDRAAAAVARIPTANGCPDMFGAATPLAACARVR